MKSESAIGFQSAVLAFVMWGLLPIYWKIFHGIPALEVLAHRIIWSVVFVYLILLFQGRLPELYAAMRDRRTVFMMMFSSLIIVTNWFTYIWAVNHNRVLDTSLGYFICPMMNVLLGMIFLKEKIRGLMKPAVLSAVAGIMVLAVGYGRVPYAGLVLAFTFAFYGLFRKVTGVKPLPGLFLEVLTLTPPSIAYLAYRHMHGGGIFMQSISGSMFLVGAGVVTSLPLLFYVTGASRLRFGTLGTLQYIAPTIAFFIGAFMYGEPLGKSMLITFALIWIGVFLYLSQLYRDSRRAG